MLTIPLAIVSEIEPRAKKNPAGKSLLIHIRDWGRRGKKDEEENREYLDESVHDDDDDDRPAVVIG
jgi:hypothetical protein